MRRPSGPAAFAGRTAILAALVPCLLATLPSLLRQPAARGADAAGAATPAAPPDPASAEYFEKNIRPLLESKCLSCHSAASGVMRGGLALDSQVGWARGGSDGRPVIVPGKPDTSALYKAVTYTDPALQMPPSGKLPDDQIALVRKWIAMGAPDTRGAAGGVHHLSGLTPKARAHWAFQPVVAPAVPRPKDPTGWAAHSPIDAFVLANLQGHGMHPNPKASREVLIRRAYYDLIGLPPSVGAVRAFLADRDPDAWQKVVDRLLASPLYGERWGRHWLDSARYSDTRGINNGTLDDFRYPYAWTYRDYVIRAFNQDKPYNQFLIEQIAADKLPDIQPNDPRLAALGFLTVGKHFDNPDDLIDERIDTVTKATLSLTVSCARCHDHKFDPVPTADYYSLYGIFANTIEPNVRPELAGTFDPAQRPDFEAKMTGLETQNRDVYYDWVAPKVDAFEQHAEGYLLAILQPNRSAERHAVEEKYGLLPEDLDLLYAVRPRYDDPVLGPYSRISRIPAAQFATQAPKILARMFADPRSNVNPLVKAALENLHPTSVEEVAHAYGELFARARSLSAAYAEAQRTGAPAPAGVTPTLAQIIETPFPLPAPSAFTTPEQQLAVLKSLPIQNGSQGQFLFTAMNGLRITHPGAPGCAMAVADAPKMQDSYIHIRGDRYRRGPVVPRRFLEVLSGPDRPEFTQDSGRLELARDIADPKNPLTVRSIVNRVWMYHFGDGFVRTPDDLGNQSEPPSNPKLLDWLSVKFVQNGWSLKRLHRMILLSNTYQESSDNHPAYARRDPEDRLLWRANVRRLDFEAIRDSLVALTGHLDTTLGGKPVNITDEPYSYRRSIYGYVDRSSLSDLMLQFDFSDPNQPNTARTSTIVPQQELFFMNSPMTAEVAREVLDRPEIANAPSDAARITALYLALYQRSPRPAEIQIAEAFLQSEGPETPAPPAGAAPQRPARRGGEPAMRGGSHGSSMESTESMESMESAQSMESMQPRNAMNAMSAMSAKRPARSGKSAASGSGGGTMASMSGSGGTMESMQSMQSMQSTDSMSSMSSMSSMNSMSGPARRRKGAAAAAMDPAAQRRMAPPSREMKDKYAPIQNTGLLVARTPLTPWQRYAQTLLWSNEFVYVR